MLTKAAVTAEQVAAVVAPLGAVRHVAPLSGGLFASVRRVVLDDGRQVVVKVTGADTSRLLRYEHGILATEAALDRLAHAAGLPVPRVLLVDDTRRHVDGDALVVELLDGELWHGATLTPAEAARTRRSLGRFMAGLHRITGDRFGYPAASSGLSAPTWPGALAAMLDAVLADATRWGVELPAARLADALARHHDTLATVMTPRLVHGDLWPGNLLLDPADRTLRGVLDGERALWGDPLFELAGVDQHGMRDVDPDLLAGYRAAGGELGLGDGTPATGDAGAWTRLRVYRAYFSCLLVVEVVPRGYAPEHAETQVRHARANLVRLLDELGATG
ncbi:phosphotransferase family protein [Isoptericola sp. BMS4]|uniref:phosphotransferase family protein n=1 Tax=Isoptericola sp. BMS4 TaxID=2527875 RepID=UPI0014212626|nr:aminoglycoside phosphotransferase family protein [Isoptericola sp. BMS4]